MIILQYWAGEEEWINQLQAKEASTLPPWHRSHDTKIVAFVVPLWNEGEHPVNFLIYTVFSELVSLDTSRAQTEPQDHPSLLYHMWVMIRDLYPSRPLITLS